MSTEIEKLEEKLNKYIEKNDAEVKEIKEDISNIKVFNGVVNEKLNTVITTLDKLVSKVDALFDKGKFDFLDYFKSKVIPVLIGGGIVFSILKAIGKI